MIPLVSSLFRGFAKRIKPATKFTEDEKKRLEKVFFDDEIVDYFRWKRYPINDQVFFDGEADIISWENTRISAGTLSAARSLSEMEQLDLVLVHKQPPVVRLMNYRNFILGWAFKDRDLNTIMQKQLTTSYMKLSYRIHENDLENKLNRGLELLSDTNKVVFEAEPFDRGDEAEVKTVKNFEKELVKKLKAKCEEGMVVIPARHEYVVRVTLRWGKEQKVHGGNNTLALREAINRTAKVTKFEPVKIEDEDEFMNKMMDSIGVKKEEETQIPRIANFDMVDDDIYRTPGEKVKSKLKSLLGEELAQKFLKGRFKIK